MKHPSLHLLRFILCIGLGYSVSWLSAQEVSLGNAARFHVEDLGTLPSDNSSVANKINNLGDVVGASLNIDPERFRKRAFLYRKGRMIDLGTLGGVGSEAFNLNDNGQVVGMTYQADGRYVPFLYGSGQMTDLEALAGVSGLWQLTPAAINNSGQIVGTAYERQSGTLVPFRYASGQLVLFTNHPPGIYLTGVGADINDLGLACGANDLGMHSFRAVYISETSVIPIPALAVVAAETYGMAINNAGHLLGTDFNGINFIYHDDALTFLGPFPPDYRAAARDLNDSDDVVGDNEHTPFFYHDGTISFLNDQIPRHSGWTLQWTFGLNNRSQIVGYGLHHGKTRAFLLTPIQ